MVLPEPSDRNAPLGSDIGAPETNGHRIYRDYAPILRAAGIQNVIPLPKGQKAPPPSGFTGQTGQPVNSEQVQEWRDTRGGDGIGIVPEADQLFIDIDNYAKGDRPAGRALEVIAEVEERAGVPWPRTYGYRNRTDGSVKWFYRVPTKGLRYRGKLGAGVDLLWWGDRYAHLGTDPATGEDGEWIDGDGNASTGPVSPDLWAELPPELVAECTAEDYDGNAPGMASVQEAERLLSNLPDGAMSQSVREQMDRALRELSGLNGSRHDTTLGHVRWLILFGVAGLTGTATALKVLRHEFVETVWNNRDRNYSRAVADAEFERMLTNRARLVAAMPDLDGWSLGLKAMEPGGWWHPDTVKVWAAWEPDEQARENDGPIPLTQAVQVPPFPVDALPGPIADHVRAIAEATQTDPAMAGTSALTVLAACNGGHAVVEVRRGWTEPLNIYTVTIADVAERKSAVQSAMVEPINHAEKRLDDEGKADRIAAATRKKVATDRAAQLQRTAAKIDDEDARTTATNEAITAVAWAEMMNAPPAPRIVAGDITAEAVAEVLADQGGRLAIISAEGGVLDVIAGRYSNMPNLDVFLMGHSGDHVRIDRKSGPPVHIPRPALSFGLMIQPDVLRTIAKRREFRGRGLLARFLYARPVSKLGSRKVRTEPVPEPIKERYENVITELALGMAENGRRSCDFKAHLRSAGGINRD